MRILDLFCGSGGAGMGYYHAGFRVAGVDIVRQPRYPFRFWQAECLHWLETFMEDVIEDIDAIHASPPCQHFSSLNNGTWGNADGHPDLIAPTRALLEATGLPYVIENVPGSPLIRPTRLCGSMFGLEIEEGYLQRHRLFETNWPLEAPGPCRHDGQAIGVYGHGRGGGPSRGRSANADQARRLMQMPWANRDGCSQAIPPAYTEYIGRQLCQILARISPRPGRR